MASAGFPRLVWRGRSVLRVMVISYLTGEQQIADLQSALHCCSKYDHCQRQLIDHRQQAEVHIGTVYHLYTSYFDYF